MSLSHRLNVLSHSESANQSLGLHIYMCIDMYKTCYDLSMRTMSHYMSYHKI